MTCQECSTEENLSLDGLATQDIGSVHKDVEGQTWEVIEVTLDSGACETVAPSRIGEGLPIQETKDSKAGKEYTSADCGTIRNEGQRKFEGLTDDFVGFAMTAQVCEVNKFLAAASRICEAGNKVVLDEEGSYVENKATGRKTKVEKIGGTYRFRIWVKKDKKLSTGRFDALGDDGEEEVFARLGEELL